MVAELAVGHGVLQPVLSGEDDSGVLLAASGSVTKCVFGVVKRRAGKPPGAGHDGRVERGGRLVMEEHAEEFCGGGPEGADVLGGPGVQCGVVDVGGLHTVMFADEPGELRDRGVAACLWVGGPQNRRRMVIGHDEGSSLRKGHAGLSSRLREHLSCRRCRDESLCCLGLAARGCPRPSPGPCESARVRARPSIRGRT